LASTSVLTVSSLTLGPWNCAAVEFDLKFILFKIQIHTSGSTPLDFRLVRIAPFKQLPVKYEASSFCPKQLCGHGTAPLEFS
jgi:hypothetical protein